MPPQASHGLHGLSGLVIETRLWSHMRRCCVNSVPATPCQPSRASHSVPATPCQQLRASNSGPATPGQPLRASNSVPATPCQQLRASQSVPATPCQQLRVSHSVPATPCQQHHASSSVPATQCQQLRASHSRSSSAQRIVSLQDRAIPLRWSFIPYRSFLHFYLPRLFARGVPVGATGGLPVGVARGS